MSINDLGAPRARKWLRLNDLRRKKLGTLLEYLDSRPGMAIE